jgi:hypothetical protein
MIIVLLFIYFHMALTMVMLDVQEKKTFFFEKVLVVDFL